jgi:hypothetical protein
MVTNFRGACRDGVTLLTKVSMGGVRSRSGYVMVSEGSIRSREFKIREVALLRTSHNLQRSEQQGAALPLPVECSLFPQ